MQPATTTPAPDRPMVRRFADADALGRAAADELAALIRAAVAARGACSVALAGGSTPRRMLQELAARGPGALPWDRVDLWWGDERTVPPDHADANYRMAREALIDPLGLAGLAGLAGPRVHRIAGELDPAAAARAYEDALVAALGAPPVLDVVMLGMGADGHTASLFPGSPGLDETERWVVANPVRSPLVGGSATRITLTVPAINAARHVRFVVAGADKAEVLGRVLDGPRAPARYPAQRIAPHGGDLAWLVDAAAAAGLRGGA
jgi:6-phosphogluconolactonase